MRKYGWSFAVLLLAVNSAAGPRKSVIYFDQLNAEITRDGVEVRYRVNRRASPPIEALRDRPMVSISVRDENSGQEETYEAPLRVQDEIVVDLGGWRPNTSVRLWVYSRVHRRYFMGFGNVIASAIEPQLQMQPQDTWGWNQEPPPNAGTPGGFAPGQGAAPPPNSVSPPPSPNWMNDPEVIRACSRHFTFGSERTRCLETVRSALTPPIPVIAACKTAFEFNSTALECLEKSVRLPYLPESSIKACGRLSFSSQKMECIDLLASTRRDSSAVIDACATSMFSDSESVDCIRVALGHRGNR